jgi:hypothetical protein
MSYIKDVFQRILSNQHSEYDLSAVIRSIIRPRSNEHDDIRKVFTITGNNNVIQYGNSNISTLQVDGSIYDKRELDVILNALSKHLQEVKNIVYKKGCEDLEPRDFQVEKTACEKISYRHLTGLNEYSTLSLVEEEMPAKLRTILGIEKTPVIYTDSPIIENIRKFRRETGNQLLISYEYNNATMTYATNMHGQTYSGLQSFYYDGQGERFGSGSSEKYSQSIENFENDTLSYQLEWSFDYSPVYSVLQNTKQDALWTSITKGDGYNDCKDDTCGGIIFQFPKLSSLSSLRFSSLLSGKSTNFRGCDYWILKIIDNNPEIRGFLLFGIPYLTNISEGKNTFLPGGCGDSDPLSSSPILRFEPTPYVRFIDVCNVSNLKIRIKSITFKVSNKSEYTLTPLNSGDRTTEIYNGTLLNLKVDISLIPQNNVIIPIEFGFDTKAYEKHFCYRTCEISSDLSQKDIHVFEMPDKESIVADFITSLESTKKSLYSLPSQEVNLLLSKKIQLSNEFLSNNKEINELIKQSPRRFAVGSFMDVVSINVDGEEIEIDRPNETPKFSISMNYGYGSCPYLMVYSPEKKYWKELGTILYARKSRELQGTEVFNLGDSTTKFRIEEREQEITFVKSLSILYKNSQNNQQEEVKVSLIGLTEQKKEYSILKQGQHIQIDLCDFIPLHSSEIQLIINGYYEIIESPDTNSVY